jgi:hypothetical protein
MKSAPALLQVAVSPEQSRGLATLRGGDGLFTMADVDGAACWRMEDAYLYFAIDEKLHPWPTGAVDVEIEYFDSGAGDIAMEYDSTDLGLAFNGAYKVVPTDIIHRSNSGRWQMARMRILDPRFSGGQNMHADFRIQHAGDPLLVRAVRMRRGT